MSKSKRSPTKKDKKTNPAITIAIIGLVGTIAAAFVTSLFNYLSTHTQVSLPIQSTQTAEAGTATALNSARSIATAKSPVATQGNQSHQESTIEMTFRNDSQTSLEIRIRNLKGSFIVTLDRPPGTSQVIKLPPGHYTYEYLSCSSCKTLPKIRRFVVESAQILCFSELGLDACTILPKPYLYYVYLVLILVILFLLLGGLRLVRGFILKRRASHKLSGGE